MQPPSLRQAWKQLTRMIPRSPRSVFRSVLSVLPWNHAQATLSAVQSAGSASYTSLLRMSRALGASKATRERERERDAEGKRMTALQWATRHKECVWVRLCRKVLSACTYAHCHVCLLSSALMSCRRLSYERRLVVYGRAQWRCVGRTLPSKRMN